MRWGSNEGSTKDLKPILSQLHLTEACPKAVYLAVPVTSGIRLWNLAVKHNVSDIDQVREAFPREFENQVLRANHRASERLAGLARKRFPTDVVVNPSVVNVHGWSQAQYRRAWKRFISRFAKLLIAATGWQFSYGCVDEVTHALQQGVAVVDVSGQNLSFTNVHEAILAARDSSIRKHLRVPFLKRFLTKLEPKKETKKHGTKGNAQGFVEAARSGRTVRKLSS